MPTGGWEDAAPVRPFLLSSRGMCPFSFVFTVQLRLASLGLLHVKKVEEWAIRNHLHQENNPEVK
jgi:hypothetical protein